VGTGSRAYHVFDVMWLDGRDVTDCRSKNACAVGPVAFQTTASSRRLDRGSVAVGPGPARRLGRSDREATRFNVRAPAFAALVER
jgi:hypothetical protein